MTASSTPTQPTPLGGGSKKISNEPLFGFVPRRATAIQVQGALVREVPPGAAEKY